MFFTELETNRLLLRNMIPDDREFIYRHFSDTQINKYLFDAEPVTDMKEADEIIEFYRQLEPRMWHRWIIIEKESGIPIGTCGFHCWVQKARTCDVGYDLASNYWGKGYMNEAMKAILNFSETKMNIKEIRACIYPDNHASIRVALKLGFVWNGEMKDEIFRGEKYPHQILKLKIT